MFEQFGLSDVVVSLVKLAIDAAEHDDPNLVSAVPAQYQYCCSHCCIIRHSPAICVS